MTRTVEEIDYPKTVEEYWLLVDYYADNLQELIAQFHPFYKQAHYDMPITALRAERICEIIREQIAEIEPQDDPQVRFRKYKKERNPEIVNLLNETWFGVPESSYVHSRNSFYTLCDLCSEGYLVQLDCEEDE